MIKQEIRSVARNLLPKVDKSNLYHDLVIDAICEKVINSMYEEIWKSNPLNLQKYIKQYGYTVPLAVNTEAGTGIKYTNLTANSIYPVPFQDKAGGIRRISTILQGALKFIPMDARERDLLGNGAYFNNVSTLIGYSVNQTRIEYYGMTNAIQAVGVRLDVVTPFSKYDESDVVLIPEIIDLQTKESFSDRVRRAFAGITPADLKDDNASAQGKQTDN